MTIKSDVKDQASNVAANVKGAVSEAAETVTGQAHDIASQAKDTAALQISGVADALRGAANELTNGSAAERTLGQIANGFADASESLQGKDLGELISSASHLAKRNPALFLGGALLIGFAGSRFLKASSLDATPSYDDGDMS